jgi:ferritin
MTIVEIFDILPHQCCDARRRNGQIIKRKAKMLNKKIQDAFNAQLTAEYHSSYLYLAMCAYFEENNFRGMASWMKHQAQEEMEHALKFFDQIIERGGSVKLSAIDAPPNKWKSPLDAFESAYKHECMISGRINDLADLATKENDHASNVFLQWFVTEQVEEESSVLEIVEKLKLIGDHMPGLFMIDAKLGQRS